MAKQKKTEEGIFQDLAKDLGGKVLSDEKPVNYYLDTGNLAVNYICSGYFMGGGIPGGRITELLGPSSGGKSLWGTNVVRGVQAIGGIPAYLDCENALNPQFAAKASHVNPKDIVHFKPGDGIDCLEGVFLKVYNVIRKVREKYKDKPLAFIYDSIGVSPSERELRETTVSENFTEAEWKKKVGSKEQPGERAKICNREFRKLEAILEGSDCTMLVINQIRQKIGVLYGNPEVGAGGGGALEYYACCRLRASAHKKIENKRLGTIIGVNLKVKNIKNRCHRPFMEAEGVQLFFDKGVNPVSGLLTLLEQVERIEKVGNGVYQVKEPWAAGQVYTFRGSKARNDIDPEVLYRFPGLVDAKDEQEIRDYLAIFKDAMEASNSDDTNEKEITNEFFDDDGSTDSNDLASK